MDKNSYNECLNYCKIIAQNSYLYKDLFQHTFIIYSQYEHKLKSEEEKIKYFKKIAKTQLFNKYSTFNRENSNKIQTTEIIYTTKENTTITDCFKKFLDKTLPLLTKEKKEIIYSYLKNGKIKNDKVKKIYPTFVKQKKELYELFLNFDCDNNI